MKLYIQVKDGLPFEHPIFEDNFREAFPDVDVNNLPPHFARFTRVEPPMLGPYQVYLGVTYEPCEGGYTDVHHVREMNLEERANLQNLVKAHWAEKGLYPDWVFDEETCKFYPTARPNDGKMYRWDEPTLSWIGVA